uniref:RNA-directed DNA polymerase n=1 Tax=Drosophila sechellia TaxID=7238 RepID=A0A175ETJ3_DROSE|nr:TPA_exp: gag-pol protein [Drosophila sechellia]
MAESVIRPFLCETIEKSLLRVEWEKWLRAFEIYVQAEEIISSPSRKRNKLLHLGGPQLQTVAFSLPGAVITETAAGDQTDIFQTLVDKLNAFFSPKQNSSFERHLFRNLSPAEGETFAKFVLRLRYQIQKCDFGSTKAEIEEICLKDKIIDSCANISLKRKLLEKEYNLSEIINLCQMEEEINKESEIMRPQLNLEGINRIQTNTKSSNMQWECSRCGRKGHNHNSPNCPALKQQCNKCTRFGHFANKCRTNLKRPGNQNNSNATKRQRSNVNLVNEGDDKKPANNCFKILSDDEDEVIKCQVGGQEMPFIIDSGSRFNLISPEDWSILQDKKATIFNVQWDCSNHFRAYASDELLQIICCFDAPVSIGSNPEVIAPFFVIKKGKQSLLGKETAIKLQVLRLGLEVHSIESVSPFPKWKGLPVKLSIDPDIKPVQQPMRRIPIALEEKVIGKLEEALALDIIEPVIGHSQWISPMVMTFKENGDLRICIDMRLANKAILRENYPLPIFETFMTKLRGAKYFSRLDLKYAYHQLELDEASRAITTFITPRGLFRYKRLMFGVNSAPEIFQRRLEELLAPCRNVLNYIDDIIIFGTNENGHDNAVKEIKEILEKNNVLLNGEKCIWKTDKVKFLGHILSDRGIEVDPEKVSTILSFRSPKNKEEVRSFLGLVTYVGKFIPDLADRTEPLRRLLRKDCRFNWDKNEEKAYKDLKSHLAKIPNLSYFDPDNTTQLIADASPVALGAVLLQFTRDKELKIISFASRSLSDVEKRYSQTEKESLALVWAVEKFYFYLAGLEFELVTDHKPLEAIFKPTSKPPARIERWLLRIQAFKFKVIYKAGKENISDALSRLCEPAATNSSWRNDEYNVFRVIEYSVPAPLHISEISQANSMDEEIIDAMACLETDTWDPCTSNKFYPFRYELSTLGKILLRGTRLVIPATLRKRVLELAHEGHPGESAMKRRLRSKVWWPRIDRDAENFVKACRDCLVVSQPLGPAPMQRTPFPTSAWMSIASDLLGPLPNGKYVLVFIDYFSRYMELKFMQSISSTAIIGAMKEIFCRLGFSKYLRTDNGRQYVSEMFENYCSLNGITLIRTPPYWPQANGEVENINKSLVKRLKIAHLNKKNLEQEIQEFLLMHNVTPHGTTGTAPSELMFNRLIRDKIPNIQDVVGVFTDSAEKDNDQIQKHKGKVAGDKKRGAKDVDIQVGDQVLMKNVIFPSKLTPNFDITEYQVLEREGNIVKVSGGGKTLLRDVSHLKKIPAASTTMTVPASTTNLEEHNQHLLAKSSEENDTSARPGLKLKLKNIGGMWEPVREEDERNSRPPD